MRSTTPRAMAAITRLQQMSRRVIAAQCAIGILQHRGQGRAQNDLIAKVRGYGQADLLRVAGQGQPPSGLGLEAAGVTAADRAAYTIARVPETICPGGFTGQKAGIGGRSGRYAGTSSCGSLRG